MKAHYLVNIENPELNVVKVTLKLNFSQAKDTLEVFIPSWSPGSYLMREYARHIRWVQFTQSNGETLFYEQKAKGLWEINWNKSDLNKRTNDLEVSYLIYLNELTVRTSQVNSSHAFLHGPSYLMGVVGEKLIGPTIEFRFPGLWSKLSTSLKDVSTVREKFIYSAQDYDELLDCPVEIGCQETDGFEHLSRPHHLAFFGTSAIPVDKLKLDIKQIVKSTALHFKNDLPYDHYLFLTHFGPKLRGGLEHLSSTALQFDGRKLINRKDYISYLSLVAHEYFHLWNVKRIRPKELGPFDYLNENYTSMLWLAEGLTSFMDDLLVYRSGLCTLEEYLEQIKINFESYYSTPGRKFHSLEQSSFNAWIKLYRPDENFKNSSISYYLKGGLVFMALHSLLLKKDKSIDDLLLLLWSDYKSDPDQGVLKEEVYQMVKSLGGSDVLEKFSTMIETTQEIDFDSLLQSMGLEINWQAGKSAYLGFELDYLGDRAVIRSVTLDSPATKAGLNSQDEILAIGPWRFLKDDVGDILNLLQINQCYEVLISRMGQVQKLEIIPEIAPRSIKEIAIQDRALAEKSLAFKNK